MVRNGPGMFLVQIVLHGHCTKGAAVPFCSYAQPQEDMYSHQHMNKQGAGSEKHPRSEIYLTEQLMKLMKPWPWLASLVVLLGTLASLAEGIGISSSFRYFLI